MIKQFVKAFAVGTVAIMFAAPPSFADHHQGDREAVMAVVTQFFDALEARDAARMNALAMEGANLASTRHNADGEPIVSVTGMGENPLSPDGPAIIERGFDEVVEIEGNIASVWLPYDIYVDGEFIHCGIDAFLMIRHQGVWKITSLAYSAVTDGTCRMHPDGPPG
jgi:hypothetical protein